MGKKLIKKILSSSIILFSFLLSSCEVKENTETCNHEKTYQKLIEKGTCIKKEKYEEICSLCNKTLNVYEGDYGEHKYNNIVEVEPSSTTFGKIKYTCEYCFDTYYEYIEYDGYQEDISKYNFVIINNEAYIEKYLGNEKDIVIPEYYLENNTLYPIVGVASPEVFYLINATSITFPSTFKYASTNLISYSNSLKRIDLSKTYLKYLSWKTFYYNRALEEVIFPASLEFYDCGISFSPNIKELNFLETKLKYLYQREINSENHIEKLILPSTIVSIEFFDTRNLVGVDEIYVDTVFIPGSLYYRANSSYVNKFEDYYSNTVYFKRMHEEIDSIIKIIHEDGTEENLILPYGENLYDIYNNENYEKIGFYYDEARTFYFSGIIPYEGLTLYALNLNNDEEVFFNRHIATYVPKFDKSGNVIFDDYYSFFGLITYLVVNEIYDINILSSYDMYFIDVLNSSLGCDPVLNMFQMDGFNGRFKTNLNRQIDEKLFELNILRDTYEEYKKLYDLENVKWSGFNYRDYFYPFDSNQNKRSDDFNDFPYKQYPVLFENVESPSLMAYLMSFKIGVTPKKGSDAEKCLEIYEDICRNVVSDDMNMYEKILNLNRYFSFYDPIGVGNGSSGKRAYFSNVVDLIPIYSGVNCGTAVSMPRLLYAIEGITSIMQNRGNHVYNVIKMGDYKYYLADSTPDNRTFKENWNYNIFEGYKENIVPSLGYSVEERISHMYPYVKLSPTSYIHN